MLDLAAAGALQVAGVQRLQHQHQWDSARRLSGAAWRRTSLPKPPHAGEQPCASTVRNSRAEIDGNITRDSTRSFAATVASPASAVPACSRLVSRDRARRADLLVSTNRVACRWRARTALRPCPPSSTCRSSGSKLPANTLRDGRSCIVITRNSDRCACPLVTSSIRRRTVMVLQGPSTLAVTIASRPSGKIAAPTRTDDARPSTVPMIDHRAARRAASDV